MLLIKSVRQAREIMEQAKLDTNRDLDNFKALMRGVAEKSFWFYVAFMSPFREYKAPSSHDTHGGKPWAHHPFIIGFCNLIQRDFEERAIRGNTPFYNIPRLHFKTTLFCMFLCWLWVTRQVSSSAILTHKIEGLGKSMIGPYATELAHMHKIWPEMVPDQKTWLKNSVKVVHVKSIGGAREDTVGVYPITSIPTGFHSGVILFDDPVTKENRDDLSVADAIRDCVALESLDGSWMPTIGTRWGKVDAYYSLARGHFYSKIHHAAAYNKEGKPILHDKEFLERWRRKMGDDVFACQMMNNPNSESITRYDDSYIKRHTYKRSPLEEAKGKNIYMWVDASQAKSSKADHFAVEVVAVGTDKKRCSIDMYWGLPDLSAQLRLIFDWHAKYRPILVFCEGGMSQTSYGAVLEREMEATGYRFKVQEINNKRNKNLRIGEWYHKLRAGQYWHPESYGEIVKDDSGSPVDRLQAFITDEFLTFNPYNKNNPRDNCLDCKSWFTSPEFERYVRYPSENGMREEGEVKTWDFGRERYNSLFPSEELAVQRYFDSLEVM